MTVSTTGVPDSFALVGGTTVFNFTNKIFVLADLVVIRTDTAGVETTLVITTDYTISAAPWETGGSITTVVDYQDGTLTIKVVLPQTQAYDYTTADKFPAQSHEDNLDRSVLLIQSLDEKFRRAVLSKPSATLVNLALPVPVINNHIGWNSAATALENKVPTETATPYIGTLLDDDDAVEARGTLRAFGEYDTIALLRAATSGGGYVRTKGHTTIGIGGLSFYWAPASTATDNNGTIIKLTSVTTGRYLASYDGPLFPEWFGAIGSGTTNDTTACNAALGALPATGGEVYFGKPNSRYLVSSSLNITIGGTTVKGSGIGSTTIQMATHDFNLFNVTAGNFHLRNISVIALAYGSSDVYVVDEVSGSGGMQITDVKFAACYSGIRTGLAKTRIHNITATDFKISVGIGINFTGSGEARSIDNLYFENAASNDCKAGIQFLQGGCSVHNAQFVKMGNCIDILPGNGQIVSSVDLVDCWLDTSSGSGLFVHSSGTGIVRRIRMLNCWSSSNVRGVRIDSVVGGFQIIGGHYFDNDQEAIFVAASLTLTDFLVMGIAAAGNSGSAINIGANTSGFKIMNNDLTPSNGFTGNFRGVNVAAGTSNNYHIIGNNMTGNTSTNFVDGGTGDNKFVHSNITGLSRSIASATAVTLGPDGAYFNITGTTTITSVVASGVDREVTLKFAGILTFTDGSNLKLAGNFVTTADDTITLICDGTNWYEKSRSAN